MVKAGRSTKSHGAIRRLATGTVVTIATFFLSRSTATQQARYCR
jgi:hypothetical protein